MNNFIIPGNYGWTEDRERDFSPFANSGMAPGRIVEQNHHTYGVVTPFGKIDARITGVFEYNCTGPEDFPLLGDWVVYSPLEDNQGLIHKVLPRSSLLQRLASGGTSAPQPLAANLDRGIIVMALDQDYSPSRVDRYLTLLTQAGAKGLVWLNKADLYPQKAQEARKELALRWAEIPVLCGSALSSSDCRTYLEPWLISGQTLCFLGSSGAGKSTLLNALVGESYRPTAEIRFWDGKGRHTSTDRILMALENGAMLMDHPGLREVGLWGGEESLSEVFAPIFAFAEECRFRDCTHEDEPGCRVQIALENQELDPGLWKSYQRQKSELAALARKKDPVLSKLEREKWKAINKSHRGFTKEKRSGG